MSLSPSVSVSVSVYVVNFNDEERKTKMIERFKKIGMDANFVPPVYQNDERIENTPIQNRLSAMVLQHLDSVRHFYENTENDYCIVCEDDVYISKHLNDDLPEIIRGFEALELDILLLGYLYLYSLENWIFGELGKTEKFTYYSYPDQVWGAHMYMINRKHAKSLLEKFTPEFAIENVHTHPFSPDWTITKYGKRALIAPLVGVEEGGVKTDDYGQIEFHRRCFENNYNPDIYI